MLGVRVLYVVGGLDGNPFVFDALDDLVASEADDALVVLNGDMHWFDKTAENFAEIERRARGYRPLVGNVEAELRRQEDVGVGCGCAYPDCTPDDAVSRSNRIHNMLSIAVDAHPELKGPRWAAPPRWSSMSRGSGVGITHGDEKLIGGWDCSRESLQDVMRQDEVDCFMRRSSTCFHDDAHLRACRAGPLARSCGEQRRGRFAELCGDSASGWWCASPRSRARTRFSKRRSETFTFRRSPFAMIMMRSSAGSMRFGMRQARRRYRIAIVSSTGLPTSWPIRCWGDSPQGLRPAPRSRRRAAGGTRKRADERDVALGLAKLLLFQDMLDGEEFMRTEEEPRTLQVNVTARCNLARESCHVESGPHRTEMMSRETLESVLKVARDHGIDTIDVTGGAPETHPTSCGFSKRRRARLGASWFALTS